MTLYVTCHVFQFQEEDTQQMRALHVSALYDEVGVAKLLLDAGATILCHDHEHSTPLHHACSSGNLTLVKMLLEVAGKKLETTKHLKQVHII